VNQFRHQTLRIAYLRDQRRWSFARIAKAMDMQIYAVRSRYHRHKIQEEKAEAAVLVGQDARRMCLMCRKDFDSQWPGERICKSCKMKPAYRSGSDFDTPAVWGR